MCGIYGTTRIDYPDNIIDRKLERIKFRGPDYSSMKRFDKVALGHNRLAIVDLDSRSNQPFQYEHTTIVFNGEIYNFKSLKSDLTKKGFKFVTSSDTEVICAAYLAYGEACVKYFNGMFAFVIHDAKKQLLFGARDRLGQKPFYYSLSRGRFEFASQISQIAIGNDLTINEKSISQFLSWKYIPEPSSIYNEVKKLKAGFSFIYSLDKNEFTEKQYWDIPDNYGSYEGNYESACADLEELLTDAIGKRMIADVPLGVFLSGGIDSSLIAALAQKQSDSSIKTFSIKFNEKGFDESIYAEEVAKILGTTHLTIPCDYNEGIELIQNHNFFYDEPFSDSSAIPSMLLAKHTKKHVTVALTGDAGDESFLGYTRYNWMTKVSPFFKTPYLLRHSLGKILQKVPNYKLSLIGNALQKEQSEDLYIQMMSSLNNNFLIDKSQGLSNSYNHVLYNSKKPLLERVSDYDLKTYLNGDINTKVDRATMAFSLEARSPFLDYRVVELARQLPTSYKYAHGNQKRILKDILTKYLPKNILNRPKSGFTMPFENWFRNELKELVYDTLSEEKLKNIPNLNVKFVSSEIEKHMNGKTNFYPTMWSLITLVNWFDTHARKN